MRNTCKPLHGTRKCARVVVAAVAAAVTWIALPAAFSGARASAQTLPVTQGSSVVYDTVTGDLAAFQVTPAGAVQYTTYQGGTSWQPWRSLGGNFRGTVSAVSVTTPSPVMNVFATAADGSVQENSFTAARHWTGWKSLGGRLASSPAVLFLPASNTYQVFGISSGHGLNVDTWTGLWQGWRALGGFVTGTASPLFDNRTGNVEVYATGTDGIVKQAALTASGWTSLRSVGASGVTGNPSAIFNPSNGGQPEVYATSGGQLTVRTWTPAAGWQQATPGEAVTGSPGAIFDDLTGNVEVYYQGSDGTLRQYARTPAGVSGTRSPGGSQQLQSDPVPLVSPLAPPAMDVFAMSGGKLMVLSWSTQTRAWGSWQVAG